MTTTITTTPIDETRRHAGVVSKDGKDKPDPEVPERGRGQRRYSASYRARILSEYEVLDKAAKGALLRRKGLYSSLISEWRKQKERGDEALARPAGRAAADPRDKEVARLKRQVERLDAELDTAHKVIEIQGKLSALLEQIATARENEEVGGRRRHATHPARVKPELVASAPNRVYIWDPQRTCPLTRAGATSRRSLTATAGWWSAGPPQPTCVTSCASPLSMTLLPDAAHRPVFCTTRTEAPSIPVTTTRNGYETII